MITLKRKKIFEGEAPVQNANAQQQPAQDQQQATAQPQQQAQQPAPAQPQQQPQPQIDAPEQIINFIVALFNNIKNACNADGINKAITALKASENDENLKTEIAAVNKAIADFQNTKTDPKNIESIQNTVQGYNNLITALIAFGKKAAAAKPAENAQQTQQPQQ